jgi:hypothetical protein
MALVPPARHLLRAKDLAERPYGINASFRDPSRNHIRLTQVREMATA